MSAWKLVEAEELTPKGNQDAGIFDGQESHRGLFRFKKKSR